MQSSLNSLNVAITATKHNTATSLYSLSSLVVYVGVLKSFLLQFFKKATRLFLLPFLIVLAFTLVSCGGGSSSTTPSVTPPAVDGDSDSKPLTISFLHTGLHEAIIAVSKGTADTVGFMVSKSTTAPVFNDIKDKSIFYTRDLVANTPLNVYLSVTDKTPEIGTGFTAVDKKLTNPEQFLEKNTAYTLYVYQLSNGKVIQTETFTTIDYPTDAEIALLPAGTYFHGIPKTVHTIGMKTSEKFMYSWLAKGLVTGVEFFTPGLSLISCNSKICFFSKEGNAYFEQQQSSGNSGTKQFQEIVMYININNKLFGAWSLIDGTSSKQNLFTFTEIK